MFKLLILFISIFFYKFFINLGRLIRIKMLYKYYFSLCTPNTNPKVWETKREVITLFKKAGIKDGSIPVLQRMGFGQLAQYKASLFNAYPTNRMDFTPHYFSMFDEARGVFKYRILECFNPFYWFNCILFAPKHLLEYLGLNIDSTSTRCLNFLLTVIYWIVGVLSSLYSQQLKIIVIQLINKFFE